MERKSVENELKHFNTHNSKQMIFAVVEALEFISIEEAKNCVFRARS